MKKIVFILLIFSMNTWSKEFKPEITIDKINLMKEKKKIHQELIKLKKDNLLFIKKLLKEKSYKPVVYDYSTTLELLLDNIPNQLEHMPSCKSLYSKLQADYKTSWENLSPPTHHIWPSFQKLCEKP